MDIFKRRPLVWAALILMACMLCLEAAGLPSACERAMNDRRVRSIFKSRSLADHLTVTGRVEFIEGKDENAKIRLTDISIETQGTVVTAKELGENFLIRFRLYVYPKEVFPSYVHAGSYLRITGKAVQAQAPVCPGEFDMQDYYRSRNVLFAIQKAEVSGYAGPFSIAGLLDTVAGKLNEGMYRIMPEEDAQTVSAIILGQRREMDQGTVQLYREGGIAHILAISGLHINLMAMGLYRLLRKRRMSFLGSSILSCTAICSFCLMTGMSISSQRAFIMFVIWCLSQILGRTTDTLCALAAASILIFFRYPFALTDAGFLLSFGCLLSLDLFAARIEAILKKLHVPVMIRMNFAAGLAVQLGTMPIMCRYFYQITPWSAIVNLVVLPLMVPMLAAGLAGSILGMALPALGIYAGAPCHYIVRIFEIACKLEKSLPLSVIVTGGPPLWQCAVYYVLLGLLITGIRKPGLQKYRRTSLLLPAAAVCLLLMRENPGTQVIFACVGQGDGILIRAGLHSCLVDCGSSTMTDVWKYRVEPMLKYYGIGKLDAVLLTHADADHTNGIEAMLSVYENNLVGENTGGITIGMLAFPQAADGMDKIAERAVDLHIPMQMLRAGNRIRFPGLCIDVLWPQDTKISEDRNENSLVLMLDSAGKKVLLTGDLENEGEARLLKLYGTALRADVLKCGHHGSKNATSQSLLKLVNPSLAVISCGIHNKYHHPAPSLIKRLQKQGIRIRRTDYEGTIILRLS